MSEHASGCRNEWRERTKKEWRKFPHEQSASNINAGTVVDDRTITLSSHRQIFKEEMQHAAMCVIEGFRELIFHIGYRVCVSIEEYFENGIHGVGKEQALHVDRPRISFVSAVLHQNVHHCARLLCVFAYQTYDITWCHLALTHQSILDLLRNTSCIKFTKVRFLKM